jgi:hypothetical protein
MQIPMQAPTVSLVLDTRFKNAVGKYQIKLRVTFCVIEGGKKKWKQKYYLTDCFAADGPEFDTIMNNARSSEHKDIRVKVFKLQHRAIELIDEFDIVDQKTFELHFLSSGSVREIDMMFNKKISDLKAEEQISTAEKYETAFRVIKTRYCLERSTMNG